METSFERNMLCLCEEKKEIIRPTIEKFNGLTIAETIGMSEESIKELEASERDVVIDWDVEYGFFGVLLKIYTKKHYIKLEIPFSKGIIISVSKIPLEIRTEVREIIKKVIAEAQVWLSISWKVREGLANINKILAFDSSKDIEDQSKISMCFTP